MCNWLQVGGAFITRVHTRRPIPMLTLMPMMTCYSTHLYISFGQCTAGLCSNQSHVYRYSTNSEISGVHTVVSMWLSRRTAERVYTMLVAWMAQPPYSKQIKKKKKKTGRKQANTSPVPLVPLALWMGYETREEYMWKPRKRKRSPIRFVSF